MNEVCNNTKSPVILFDGICNLCSVSVKFVIKRDKKKVFRFASLQGEFGQSVLAKYHLSQTDFNSFILLEDDKIYNRSSGALRVTKSMSGLWPLMYGFIIVPAFIRNSLYDFISKHRYRWFGRKEVCWIPTPELKGLFIN